MRVTLQSGPRHRASQPMSRPTTGANSWWQRAGSSVPWLHRPVASCRSRCSASYQRRLDRAVYATRARGSLRREDDRAASEELGCTRCRFGRSFRRALEISRGNPPLIRKARHDTRIHDHLPALRDRQVGIDASRRLPIFLRVHRLWHQAQTQKRRLLRFLLLWLRTLSADPGRALGRGRGSFLLCKSVTVNTGARSTADRVGGARTSILARWVPKGATVAALITPVHVCCDLDRRTHLDGDSLHFKRAALRAHALPVHRPLLPRDDRAGDPAAAWSLSTFYNWLALGAVIILGAWIVWWATERTWGKFS